MKGIHFFAEMPESRKSKSASKAYPFQPWTRDTLRRYAAEGRNVNVCAVMTDTQRLGDMNERNQRDVFFDCIGGDLDKPNSPVCTTRVCDSYLRKRAVRIDEDLARRLHPALFASGLLG